MVMFRISLERCGDIFRIGDLEYQSLQLSNPIVSRLYSLVLARLSMPACTLISTSQCTQLLRFNSYLVNQDAGLSLTVSRTGRGMV